MRLTLVISSLTSNGAERVMAILANEWASAGHGVTLITLASTREDRQILQSSIERVALDMAVRSSGPVDAFGHNMRRLARLRRAIRSSRPDVVVSFLSTTNVLTLAATRGMNVAVAVAERIDPREEAIPTLWAGMRRLLYRRADALVVQTDSLRPWANEYASRERVHVIPNPVAPTCPSPADGPPHQTPRWLERPGCKVVAMGRLTKQKGFDLLLRAFARCRSACPGWSLAVLGEGEERGALERLAIDLDIADAVLLPGHVSNPASLLRRADLFVLASRYEGFPNVLLEAMASGLPVIATDCPSGPREIVRNGIDGILVPREDLDALAAAMQSLMSRPAERARLAERAVDVRDRFALSTVMQRWNDVLETCGGKR